MIRFYRGVVGSTDPAPRVVWLCRYGYALLEFRAWRGQRFTDPLPPKGSDGSWWQFNVYGVYIERPKFMGTQCEVRGRIQVMDAKAFTDEFDKFSRS